LKEPVVPTQFEERSDDAQSAEVDEPPQPAEPAEGGLYRRERRAYVLPPGPPLKSTRGVINLVRRLEHDLILLEKKFERQEDAVCQAALAFEPILDLTDE